MFNKTKGSHKRQTHYSHNRTGATMSGEGIIGKRWLHCNQLKIGMYVNELDKPWEATRFLFQGFKIDSVDTLRAVQDACEYANVQIEKMAASNNRLNRNVGSSRSSRDI